MKTSTLKIKAFGMVAEKIGASEIELGYASSSSELVQDLVRNYPDLKGVKFSLAVNKKLISEDVFIPEYAEIALLPPFSGG